VLKSNVCASRGVSIPARLEPLRPHEPITV
jgi:hypothetical protein